MFEQIPLIAIIVSSILAMAVGSIWYSPLMFGTAWMKSVGLSNIDPELLKREMTIAMVRGILVQIIFFFILAQFVKLSDASVIPLTTIGTLLLVLLVANMAQAVVWERRSVTYLLINAGYTAIVIFGGLGIIAFWPW